MIIRMDTRVLMVAEIVLLIISLQSAQGMFREETTKKKSQPQTSANQQAYSSNWNRNQTPRQQSADYSPQASSFTKVEEGASEAAVLSSPGDKGFTNSDRSTFSPKSRRSRVKTYRYPSDGKVTTRDPTYTTSVTTKTRPQTRRRYRTRKKGGRRVPNKRRLRKRRRRPGRNSRRRSQQSSGDEISELEEYELEDEPKLAASSTQLRKASSSLSRTGTIAGYSSSKGFGIDGDEIEKGTRLPDDFAGYSTKEQASGSRLQGLKPDNQGQKHTLPLNQRQGPTQSQPVTQSKTTVITSKSTEGTSPRFVQQSNDPGVRDGFTVQKSSSKIPTVPSSRNQGSTIANQPSKVVESSTVIRKQSAGPQESTSTRIQQVPSNTGQVTTRVSQITEGKSFNTHEEKSKAGNSQQSREIERSWVGGKPSDERVFITKQTSASSSASRDKSIKTEAQEKFVEKKQVEVAQDTSPRSSLAGTTTKTTRVSPASRRVQASSTRRESASAQSSRSHQESSRTVIEKKVGAQRSTAQAPKRLQNQEAQRSTAQASRRSQNQQSLTRQSNRRTTDVASSRDQTGNGFTQKTINQQTSPAWVTEVKNQSPRGTVTDEKKVFSGSPQSQDKQSLESISKTVTQTSATRGTADAGSIRGNTPTFTRTEVITYDEQPIVISQSPRVITERTGVPPQKSIVREDVVHKGHWDEWDEEEEEEEEEEEDDWLEEHDEEEWLEEYDDEDWLEEDEEWLEEEDCEDDEGDGEHKEEWIEEHWEDYYEDEWEEAEIKRRMEEWEREWEERKYQEWKALFMDSVRERKRREWEEKCRVEKWTEIERERRRKGWEDDWDKVEEVKQKAAWGERWKEMIFEERKKIVDEVHEEEDHHHYKPGVRSEIITTTTTSFITKDGTDSGRVNPSEKVPQSPKPAEKTTTETIITRTNTPERSQQGPLGRELDKKDQPKSLDLSRTTNNQITTVKVTDNKQTPSSQGGSNVITVVKSPTSQNERIPDWKSTNKGATITTTSTTTNKDDQPSQSTRNISKQQSSRGARIEPSQQRSQLKNRPGSDSRSKKITNSPRKERKRTVTTVTTTKRTSRPRTSSSRTQKADRSNQAEKPEVQRMSTVTQEPATNKKSSPRRTTKQSSSQTPRNRNNNDPKPLSSRTPTSGSPTTKVPGNRSEAKESQSRQALSRDTSGTGQSPNRLEVQRPSIEPMRGPEKREPGNNSVQKPVPQPMKKDSEKVPTPQKSSTQSPQGTSKTPSREIPHRQQQSTLQDPKSQKPAITQMKTTQEMLTSPSKETPQRQQPTSQKPTITQMKSTQKTPNSPTKETPQNQQPTSKELNSQKPTIIQMKTTQQTSTPAPKSMPQNELSEQKDSTPQKAPIVPMKTIQESSTPASKTTLEKGQPKSEDSTPQKAPIVPMKTIQESSTPAPKTTIEKGQPKSDNSTPQKASIVPTQTTQEPTTPAPKSTPQKEQLEKKESIPQKAPIVPMKTNQESSTPAPKSTTQKEQPKLEDSTHQKAPIVPMKTTQESSTPAPKIAPQKEQLAVKDSAPQKASSSPIDPIKTTKELSTPAPKSTPQKEQSKLEDSTHQKAPIVPTKTTQGPSTPAPKSTPQKEQSLQKDPTPQKVPIVPMKTTQPSTPAPKSTVQIEQPKEKDSTPQKASSPLIDPMKTTQKPSSPDSKTTPQKEQLTVRDPTPQKYPNVPMQTTKGSSTSSPKETPQQPSSGPKDKTPQHLSITPMKTTQGTSTTSKQNQQQHQPTTKETIPKTPSITPTKMKSPENVVGPEKASSSRLRHEQNRKSGILTQQKPVLTSKTPSISQATRKDSASEKILVKPMKHDSGSVQPSSRTTSKIQQTDTLKSQKPSIVRGKQISESSQSPQTFITKTKAVREPGNDWGSIEQKSVKVVSARRGSGRTEGQDVFLKKNIQNSSISRQKQIEAEGINASRSSSRSRVTQYSAQKKDRSLKKGVSNYSRGSQVSGGMGKSQGDSTLRTSQSSRATRKRIMHYPGSRSSLKANDLSFTKSSDVAKDQALRKSFRRGRRIRNKQSSLIRPELSSQDVGRISSRRHDGFSSAESQADLFRKLLARDSSLRRSYQDVSSGYSSNYSLDDDEDELYSSQHTSHPSDSFALKSHSNIQPKWGALRRNYMNHFSPSEYNQYLNYDDEEPDYDDLYSYPLGGANDYQNHPAYLDKYWSPTYGSRQRNDVNYEWTSPRFSDYELDDELEPEGPYSSRNYPDYSYYDSKSGLRQRNDLNILTDSSENGLDFFPFGGKSFFRSPYPYIYSNLWGNNKLFVNGLPRYNILEYEDPNNLENSFFGSIYTPYSHHNPLYNNLWRGNQLFVDYSPTYNILDNYDPFILKDSISGSIYSPYSNHYPFYNNLWGDNKLSVNGFPRYNILEDFDSNNLQNPFSGSILSPYSHNNPFYNNLWGDNKLSVNGFPSYNILEDYDSNNLENSFSGSILSPYSHNNPFYNNLWGDNKLFVYGFPSYNILEDYDSNNLENSFSGSILSPYSHNNPFYNNLWGDNKLFVNGFPSYNILEDYDSNNLENSFSGSILSPYSHNNPFYNNLWGDNKLFVNGFPSYNILEDYDSNNLENSFSESILSPYSHNNPFYNNLWGDNKLFVNGFPSYNILEDYDSNNLENLISGSMYSPYTNHHPFYNNLWRGNPHFVDDFSKYNLLDYYDPNNPENEGLVDITNGRWGTPWYFAKFSGTKRFPYRKFPSYKKLTSGYPSYNPPPPYSKFGFNNIFSIHSPSVNPYSAESRDKYHSLLALISGRNDRTYSQVGRLNDRVRRARTNRIFGEGSLYDKSIDLTQIQDIPVTRSVFIRGNNGKLGKIINYDSDYFCGRRDPPLAISMLCGNPCFPKCLETYYRYCLSLK